MSKLNKTVPVLDSFNKIISYTTSAKARILISKGRAIVYSNSPFSIKLKGNKMTKPQIIDWIELFEKKKNIYVQNISSKQLSMQFEVSPTRVISELIPRGKKPVCITNRVPWAALEGSTDFRAMVERNPPQMLILSEKEYNDYFKRLARMNETTPEEEKQNAMRTHRSLNDKVTDPNLPKPKTLEEIEKEAEEKEKSSKVDPVSPSVVGLCVKGGKDAPKTTRMKAGDLMEEFSVIEEEMTAVDFDYVLSKVEYPSIRKWAQSKIEEMGPESDDDV
jgi:hypothetical protein